MKILFAGTPEFALPSLRTIAAQFTVVGVLTQTDSPQGRGKKQFASPVKAEALLLGLPVFEPGKLDRDFQDNVGRLSPDLLVCVAYGKIFKKSFLDLFPEGGINVHPSLLPGHRGPSPIPAAILAGDSRTGVTIQRLALKMDSGNILAQQTIELTGAETTASLTPVLAGMGADLVKSVIEGLGARTISEIPQDEAAASYCRLVMKEDGAISFHEDALTIERMIRAYTPWPLVYTRWKGKRVFFLAGGRYPHEPPPAAGIPVPGTVLGMDKDYGILIHTCSGVLFIREIQLEYKKALFWKDFLNGNRDFIGSVCGGSE